MTLPKHWKTLALAALAAAPSVGSTAVARGADGQPGSPPATFRWAVSGPAAGDVADVADDAPFAALGDRALFLQTAAVGAMPVATSAAPARRPLMRLLDQAGLAKPMDDLGLNVYGYVDASVTRNLTGATKVPALTGDRINTNRLFDLEDADPTLNQVSLTVERAVNFRAAKAFDVGFRVDTIFGGDARFVHANGLDFYGNETVLKAPDEQADLLQAYVDLAVPVGNGLQVRLGKFTYFKRVDPNASPFYSRSFSYNPGALPFTLTGGMATYAVDDKLTVEAGVVRGWDQSLKDNNGSVSFVGGASYAFDAKTTASLKLITGPEVGDERAGIAPNNGAYRTVVDVVVGHQPTPDLGLFVDVLYGQGDQTSASVTADDARWYGVAFYALYSVNKTLSVNARLEWYRDEDAATTTVAGSFYEATLGVTVTPFAGDPWANGFKIRPEVRWDYASQGAFGVNETSHNQVTVAVDAIFNF